MRAEFERASSARSSAKVETGSGQTETVTTLNDLFGWLG